MNVAVLACESFDQVLTLYRTAKEHLSEILSAFEFFDRSCLDLVVSHSQPSTIRNPFAISHPFYILIEIAGARKEHNDEKLTDFLEHCMLANISQDGVVSQDTTQLMQLWRLRESIPEAVARYGQVIFKYDVSLPLNFFYDLVNATKERLATNFKDVLVVGYGHVGDGNLHLNVSAPNFTTDLVNQLEPFVYDWTASHHGSISAEHGIGLMKAHALHYNKTPPAIQLMRGLKKWIDPNGILNPYKVIVEHS